MKKYGKHRVRNTPLCESAVLGCGIGLSFKGYKSMVEMQFSDFVTCGFNQIVNNIAKLHYRWGHAPDMVIRMPTGGSVAAGPFHSQSTEAWFTHTPGLTVVCPSTPADAKGLLLASIEYEGPVVYFEHKALYRQISDEIPTDNFTLPIGKANVLKEGKNLTIVTYGLGVHWAIKAAAETTADIEIIDLRTLSPIDWDTIKASVRKTSKVIVLHEDVHTGGIGGEISSYLCENLFEYLDAPVRRVSGLDTPIPFSAELENQFMASARLSSTIEELLNF